MFPDWLNLLWSYLKRNSRKDPNNIPGKDPNIPAKGKYDTHSDRSSGPNDKYSFVYSSIWAGIIP